MKSIAILLVAILLCPALAFAAETKNPVAVDETVMAAENAATGAVNGEAVEADELYTPATATAQDIKAEEKEALEETKM